MRDDDVRTRLASMTPEAREVLRRAMRAPQEERDDLAVALLHRESGAPHAVADLLDLASLYADFRQQLARVLAALEAAT
jgi:DNA-binding MarR family transcriptional regulator